MAVLTIALTALRSGFNTAFPARDKASDGWIGDLAHQESKSGHNPDESGNSEYTDTDSIDEVRAIDIDVDLRSPTGVTMWQVIRRTLGTPADLRRLRYIIYNRVIWSRNTGWEPREYTGSNPHDKHAHFSGDPATDSDGRPWVVATMGDDMFEQEDRDLLLEVTDRVNAFTRGLTTSDRLKLNVYPPAWEQEAFKFRAEIRAGLAAQKLRDEAILAKVVEDDADRDAILQRIDQRASELGEQVGQVDDELLAKLQNTDTPDEQVASVLRQLLGDRAASVAALLTAQT